MKLEIENNVSYLRDIDGAKFYSAYLFFQKIPKSVVESLIALFIKFYGNNSLSSDNLVILWDKQLVVDLINCYTEIDHS